MNMLNTKQEPSTQMLDHKIVRLQGRLDADSVDRKRDALTARITEDQCSVVLNVSNISFIDSTGLGFLVSLHKSLSAAGHRMVICEPTDQARMLFELTRLNQIFDILDTETAALNVI